MKQNKYFTLSKLMKEQRLFINEHINKSIQVIETCTAFYKQHLITSPFDHEKILPILTITKEYTDTHRKYNKSEIYLEILVYCPWKKELSNSIDWIEDKKWRTSTSYTYFQFIITITQKIYL